MKRVLLVLILLLGMTGCTEREDVGPLEFRIHALDVGSDPFHANVTIRAINHGLDPVWRIDETTRSDYITPTGEEFHAGSRREVKDGALRPYDGVFEEHEILPAGYQVDRVLVLAYDWKQTGNRGQPSRYTFDTFLEYETPGKRWNLHVYSCDLSPQGKPLDSGCYPDNYGTPIYPYRGRPEAGVEIGEPIPTTRP